MKRIGLIGGMTPESTIAYYRALIRLGRSVAADPLDNPVILIYSVKLSEIFRLQEAGRDDEVVGILGDAFDRLRGAGPRSGR